MSDLVETYADGSTKRTPIEINKDSVTSMVNKKVNPNPAIIVIVILLLLTISYYIYIMGIKRSLSGKWSNSEGEVQVVEHNKLNDNILVNSSIRGYVVGNAIYIENKNKIHLGVLYDNSIYWNSGDVWKKAIKI